MKMTIHSIRKSSLICLLTVILALVSAGNFAQDGEKIFKAKCASCHNLMRASTGPMLQGAKGRWADAGEAELIYDWVKDNGALRASGKSKRANIIFTEWKGAAMTAFGDLSNEDIDNVLSFVDAYQPPPPPENAGAEGVSGEEAGFPWWWLILISSLLVVIFAAMGIRKKVAYVNALQSGQEVPEEKSMGERFGAWFYKNWLFGLVICIVLFFAGISDLFSRLYQIGIVEGYQPSQEIPFDHSLHAGKLEIDCKYCHNSVNKSKHAGIPSANVCMNCHSQIPVSAAGTGGEDIARIYEAVGFNPTTKEYVKDADGKVIQGAPIVWNKVHNLPDHVFFSHKQHVNVAGVDCMQCHGDVKTYTVGRVSTTKDINALAATQEGKEAGVIPLTRPLLTMGWCIECHQEKKIDVSADASNEYYQEIHTRLQHRPDVYSKYLDDDGAISVKELGGWECAKCHY